MNLKVLLILVAIVSLFLPLGYVPLFDLDEGAFSEATREMLESGNYLTTYLDGALRFDKPILIYWLQAFSVKLFGLNEFALRLPSAIAGSLWAMAIYIFTKKEYSEKSAFYATLFMLGSLQINIIAKAAIADSLLNLFIASSLFFAWLYIKSAKKSYLYITFALIALGTLTKGPVAIMVPLVTITIYLVIKREFKFLLKSLFNPIGIVIFLAIAAPWYILEYLEQGDQFINGFFFKHNLERFNSSLESHSGSLFYFIPVLILGMLPFTSILLSTIAKFKSFLKSDLELFLTIWFTFVFIFFSLSGTKLPHYIIYGYTPMFILMGLVASRQLTTLRFTTILSPILLYITLLALPFSVKFYSAKNIYIEQLLSSAPTYFNTTYLLLITLATLFTVVLTYTKLKLEYKLTIMTIIFTITVNFVAIKAYANLAQQPIKDAALYAKAHNLKVIRYHFTKPSFQVYIESKSLKSKPKKGSILLLKATALKDFKEYKTLFNRSGIYLIEVK